MTGGAQPTRTTALKNGSEVELRVDQFAEGGAAGLVDGRRVHVPFAIPGDRLRVRILGKRRRVHEAQLLEVLEPSPLRIEPRCAYFGHCGGCRWQNLIYPAQLDAKRTAVLDAFSEVGVLDGVEVPPVLGSPDTYFYRNKMEFSFGARRWLTPQEIASGTAFERSFALGMMARGRYDRVLDLQECHLQSELTPRVLQAVRELAAEHGWSPWDVRAHTGFLRHLVLRTPAYGRGAMVNVVTNGFDGPAMERLAERLRRDFPEVATLVNTVNTGVAQVATGESVLTIFGDGVVQDRIGELEFEIGPHAFFQTNTRQAERLYAVAREYAALEPHELAFDLFCGLGPIALVLAGDARQVVGFELDAAAVRSARHNAERNGIDNAAFEVADLGRLLAVPEPERYGRPDVAVIDPPRAGIHKHALHWLTQLAPERLVYVSCNPASQARDIAVLRRRYDLERMQPVDLFPHTEHVENVALLRLRR